MLLGSLGEYENVVQVNDYYSFVNDFFEDLVHEALECCWRVGESKEHDCGFEKATVGSKRCLVLISFFDSNIIVSSPYVQLGEELGILGSVDEFLNQRKRVLVLDCPFV